VRVHGWNVTFAYHLFGYHDNRLDGKFPVAVVEEILQTGTEQINHQDVVEALLPEVVDIRNPSCRRSVCYPLLVCLLVLLAREFQKVSQTRGPTDRTRAGHWVARRRAARQANKEAMQWCCKYMSRLTGGHGCATTAADSQE